MRFFYLNKEPYAPTYYFKLDGTSIELVSKWQLPVGYGGAQSGIGSMEDVVEMLANEIGRSAVEMSHSDFAVYSTTNAWR